MADSPDYDTTWLHVVDVAGGGTGFQVRAESPNSPGDGYGLWIGKIVENFLLTMEDIGGEPLKDLRVRYRCLDYDDVMEARRAAEAGDLSRAAA